MTLHERVLEALRDVLDPELGMNVVELGLVYDVAVKDEGDIRVALTMTTPACPLGEQIARDAEDRIRALDGVRQVEVALVWDPPWSAERMTPEAKASLGW